MVNNRKPEEIAFSRYAIIAPVITALEDGTDAAKIVQLKKEVCQKNGISKRTLRRWVKGYTGNGFEGLKPISRSRRGSDLVPESIIDEAILLRRELPSRSVPQLIEILEMEGKVPVGLLKRTTLQDWLMERGYSARQMKLYAQPEIAARRFAHSERNDLWQSDIKFGPYITVDGVKKQIYLVCFIDDATRYVVHAEFYLSLDQTIVEECFRKAILREGLPKRVYFDNGKQYRNKWMTRACAFLDIRLLYTKPYSPESKGKIERFNRTLGAFLDEVSLKHCQTLDDYNKYLAVWLQECYNSREHESLKATPEFAYKSSKEPLRIVSAETIADAFRRVDIRKVDKSGCISFLGNKYEVGVLYVGQTIDISYDPEDISTLVAEPKYAEPFRIKKLEIGPRSGPRPKLPEIMSGVTPTTSRLLDGKQKQFESRNDAARQAIRYSEFPDTAGNDENKGNNDGGGGDGIV